MDPNRADPATLSVRDEAALAPRERERLGRRPTLDNCAHFARHSTKHTQLFFVKIYRGTDFLGLAPVTKIVDKNLQVYAGPG